LHFLESRKILMLFVHICLEGVKVWIRVVRGI